MRKIKRYLFISFTVFFILSVLTLLITLNKRNNQKVNEGGVSKLSSKIQNEKTRMPVVAGSFYPAGKEELSRKIDELLSQSPILNFKDKIRILIVPHAGLEYSGLVSAYGFKQLKSMDYSRVILLGSSHTKTYDYLAVDDNEYWETPLGKVKVDSEFIDTLINGQSIRVDRKPHIKEHSLEMELIFLQKALSGFKIVPVLAGQIDEGYISLLAQKIAYNFDEKTLLVVSSDLSHYPSWENANIVDEKVVNSILSGRKNVFQTALDDIESENYQNLETAACAQNAIKVSLEMAEMLGVKSFDRVKYQNSGDVTAEKDKVVGYASIVGFSQIITEYSLSISDEAKIEMLEIARETLKNYLENGKIPNTLPSNSFLNQPMGVFVTLTKNGELRGCIGEFEPTKPLYEVIRDTAVKSATKDTRFKSVAVDELSDIDIEISVMTPKRKLNSWGNIRLGIDGVVIKKGLSSGTFLPQVATDNNWDLKEFLSQLCTQKARLQRDCYKDSFVDIYSFEVLSFEE